MREYEVVYIFRSALETEQIDGKLESFHDRLTGGGSGEITALEHWGKRKLAYPIQNEENGYYVVAQFRAEPAVLEGFERALQMDDDLLRHLVVLSEGELPTPPSARRAGQEEEADGDEDGEDEEDEEEEEEGEEDEEEDEAEEEDEGEENGSDDEGEEDGEDEEKKGDGAGDGKADAEEE